MAIFRLVLTDFRSWRDLVITPRAGLVILTGENGAGKTNILEAISMLAPGRGLRGAALGEIARSGGGGGFAVAARLNDGTDIGVGTLKTAPERRQVRISSVAAPAAALAERLALLWLTPAMDRLLVDGAGARRRFLDRLVLALEPAHARHAARYEAAMRERSRLLSAREPADGKWLAAIEAQMVEYGSAMAAARERTIEALEARVAGQDTDAFPSASIAAAGWKPASSDPADHLAAVFRANRVRDAETGRTLAGPHRSDLAIIHRRKQLPAGHCSTGEQKALLLGIVLAHADLVADRAGRRPLLLLDEVAAHFDARRRTALFDRLLASGGQVWLTGTEHDLFSKNSTTAQRFHVGHGSVAPLS